jgi:hypothetical protein
LALHVTVVVCDGGEFVHIVKSSHSAQVPFDVAESREITEVGELEERMPEGLWSL